MFQGGLELTHCWQTFITASTCARSVDCHRCGIRCHDRQAHHVCLFKPRRTPRATYDDELCKILAEGLKPGVKIGPDNWPHVRTACVNDVMLNDDPSASALQHVPAGRGVAILAKSVYKYQLTCIYILVHLYIYICIYLYTYIYI